MSCVGSVVVARLLPTCTNFCRLLVVHRWKIMSTSSREESIMAKSQKLWSLFLVTLFILIQLFKITLADDDDEEEEEEVEVTTPKGPVAELVNGLGIFIQ